MLNCYYWFAGIWLIVLSIYSLAWSNFNVALDPQLLGYLLIGSTIAILVGIITSKRNRYVPLDKTLARKPYISIGLFTGFCIEMLHNRSVPLLNIGVFQSSSYGDFQGLPGLHVVLISLGIFYSGYLFYLYLESSRRELLFEISVIQLSFLLVFSRSSIVFSLMFCAIIFLSKHFSDGKRFLDIKITTFLVLVLLVVLVPYIFGILGNARSGVPIFDESYISDVAAESSSYPRFISKQYLWAYSYLTSPLANLNLNIMHGNTNTDLIKFLLSMVPETISKSLTGELSVNALLWYEPLNACTGFIEPYYFGGIAGLWISMLVSFVYLLVLQSIHVESPFHTLVCAACCLVIICQFFLNSFSFMGLAPIPIFAVICLLWNDARLTSKN